MSFDPSNSGLGSSKWSNSDIKEPKHESVGESDQPKGRKDAKRRCEEKSNNIVAELVTSYFKEFNATNSEVSQVFKDLVTVVSKKARSTKEVIY